MFFEKEPTQEEIDEAVKIELSKEWAILEKIRICGYGEPLLFPHKVISVCKAIKKFNPDIKIELITSGWPYYYKLIQTKQKTNEHCFTHTYL